MVLVAKEPYLCNHKPKEPSLCNQIWVSWLFGSVLVGDFFVGGGRNKGFGLVVRSLCHCKENCVLLFF